jgi:hypothetical protein
MLIFTVKSSKPVSNFPIILYLKWHGVHILQYGTQCEENP